MKTLKEYIQREKKLNLQLVIIWSIVLVCSIFFILEESNNINNVEENYDISLGLQLVSFVCMFSFIGLIFSLRGFIIYMVPKKNKEYILKDYIEYCKEIESEEKRIEEEKKITEIKEKCFDKFYKK